MEGFWLLLEGGMRADNKKIDVLDDSLCREGLNG